MLVEIGPQTRQFLGIAQILGIDNLVKFGRIDIIGRFFGVHRPVGRIRLGGFAGFFAVNLAVDLFTFHLDGFLIAFFHFAVAHLHIFR